MSARTKSFFEQDHTGKASLLTTVDLARPAQWSRPQHHRSVLHETSANVPPPKPPIPATSQAKSKLKAFQFIPGAPQEHTESHGDRSIRESVDRRQEMVQQEVDARLDKPEVVSPLQQQANNDGRSADDATRATPHLSHANTFPSTPGTCLPLADLIGNFDENAKRAQPPEQSPEEHIGWIPNSSSTLLTPNRKRKRARSSSPSCPTTSSQRHETSTFFPSNDAQTEKRTPEADPVADLWQRYAAIKDSSDGLKLPDLSHLMFQASPRLLETPAKGAGLRRWASTGNDWPSSKSKRRKPNGRPSVHLWQECNKVESCGKSKVASMVEKIQESLASQKLAQSTSEPAVQVEGPSSSSPLPAIGAESFDRVPPSGSPLQARRQPPSSRAAHPAVRSAATIKPLSANGAVSSSTSPTRRTPAPLVNPAESIISAPLLLHSKAPLPGYKRPSMSRQGSGNGRQYPTKQPIAPSVLPATKEDPDEFGDAFDLSAEDLEELVSQVPLNQRSLHDIPQHPNPPQQQLIVLDDDFDTSFTDQACGAQPSANKDTISVLTDDDEFGDDDIDEASFAQAEISATQAMRISPRSQIPRKPRSPRKSTKTHTSSAHHAPEPHQHRVKRYRVTRIVEDEFTNAKGRRCPEKLLIADEECTSQTTAITLRDSWITTSLSAGSIIHVARLRGPSPDAAPSSSLPGQITITDDSASPLLIVHPDHMLSATTVADSFDCIRKAVLQDRIKATGDTSKAMIYGKILHEIFQQALSVNRWDAAYLAGLVERTTRNHVEGLWELGMIDTVLAVEEIRAKMGELAAWSKVFVGAEPSEAAVVDDKQGEKVWMSLNKLIAIEEHIWSPIYGLKGNIDATVQSTLVDHPQEAAKKLIAPFEVKTGRTTKSPTHRAQTALYTLLLSDRYNVAVNAGILYYLESSAMSRISPPLNELRQMVQQRNRLAAYIHRARHPREEDESTESAALQTQEIEESGLPAVLRNPFKCGRCYARQSCFTFHALVENGTGDSAGMIDDGKKNHALVWQEAVGHLGLSTKENAEAKRLRQWFTKWDKLLTLEESELSRFRKELWTMSSAEREAVGRCFGNLVIAHDLTSTSITATQGDMDGIESSGGRINRFVYVFKRAQSAGLGGSFAEGSQLNMGEPVVVSSEQGQWALANGYVVGLTSQDITVAVDRKLGDARQRLDDFDSIRNQSFRGIMNFGADHANHMPSTELYRLDKDEFSNGLALVRNNLVMLMSSHPIHAKLRDQIISGAEPSFAPSIDRPNLPPTQIGEMNEDQTAAVSKVSSAQDYALILGMPGTGKTTTIAHIIRALLAENKSILLTSFTHTAVDNILLKIRDIAPPNSILRLGVAAKINKEVQAFCQLAATPRKTIEDVEAAYMGCKIVATTCMGTNHALFNRRAFDVCIVDEASQITLPTSLGPLVHARKFVLVGDHYQLPPLVQNRTALESGLDVSLFRQLSEEHPGAVTALGKQYRMCEDIMSLSNVLIYNGQLRCGSDEVAQRTLSTASLTLLDGYHAHDDHQNCRGRCWLTEALRPERKVMFANTDLLGKAAKETLTSGKNITNEIEVTLTAQIVLGLLKVGVPGKEIGVITLYRSQLALMRQLFTLAGIIAEVEIDSADRFQGRDKECIVLSMVRSNEAGIVGDLLKDWRRVNVALTRARSKLIILGSRQTLINNDLLARFVTFVDERGWTLELPTNADSCHTFDFSSQSAANLVAKSGPSPRKQVFPSPTKAPAKFGRQKASSASPLKVFEPTSSATNRMSTRAAPVKRPSRVISGKATMKTNKASQIKQQLAVEMFEDLMTDDI